MNWPELTSRSFSEWATNARPSPLALLSPLGLGLALLSPLGLALGRRDHLADREAERLGEVVVALVVRRHSHDRAGPVLHQHVVGDEHRDPLSVDGIGHGPPQRHPGLRLLGSSPDLGRLGQRMVDVLVYLTFLRGAFRQPEDVRMLGRHDEECCAEQRVRPGGEDGVVDAELLAAERDLRPLASADPVALHGLDVLGPVDQLEVIQQSVGVVRDPEEPLLQLARLHLRAAALTAPVDHLLVREHGLVVWAPLDRRLLAVRQVTLVEPQE